MLFRRASTYYQTLTTYHPNAFNLILSLPEGQAGIAWEPSNCKMLSPPPKKKIKCLSLLPQHLSLCFYSSAILPNSLFFGNKGLKQIYFVFPLAT
jgi:hypothetical protein